MQRPSFQFYPGDWQANKNLRRCTHAEKGIWVDVLCLMHDSEEYGVLRWPLQDVAQAVGCKVTDLRAIVDKGVMKGADVAERCKPLVYVPRSGRKDGDPVTLIPEQEGPIWFSSRMVRDEYLIKVRANNLKGEAKGEPKGESGGDPKGESEGESKGAGPLPPKGDPASSSSSSSSAMDQINNNSNDHGGVPEESEPDPQKQKALQLLNRHFPNWVMAGDLFRDLLEYAETLTWSVMVRVVEVMMAAGNQRLDYCLGICRDLKEEGINTVEAFDVRQKRWEERKRQRQQQRDRQGQGQGKRPGESGRPKSGVVLQRDHKDDDYYDHIYRKFGK